MKYRKSISRRDFLKLSGTTLLGLQLSACGLAQTPSETPVLTNTPSIIPLLTATSAPTNTNTLTPITSREEMTMDTEYYHFQLGSFECVSLYDGFHGYKLEEMFTNVPRPDVEIALQAQGFSQKAVTTPFTFLYVNTGKHRILVDIGAGDLLPTTGKLLQNMRNAEIAPESIDSIFITHAHPDHIGGVLDDKGNPIFSHAVYYICRTEWDFWFSEQAASQGWGWMADFARAKLTPIKDKIIMLDREEEILPGVSVLFAPGHTPGHMVVSFSSQGKLLLYTADTVLHPLHLEHPDWLPVFDILPESAAASKQRIFDLAASTKCWVMGQQFPPSPSLGHVIKKDVGWEWQPIE
jgi:glyoxylase-like metal-dependent hydrolase (beta-lactamase superfamily II)